MKNTFPLVFAAVFLAVCAVAHATPGLYTQFQGANPYVQSGTDSVFINDDDYATCSMNTLRIEARPQYSGVGINCVAISRLTDVYTLNGPAGTTIPVTAAFDVHYNMSVASFHDAQVATELHTPAPGEYAQGFYEHRFSSGNGLEEIGNANVSLSSTFDWTVGDSHEIIWRLAALGLQTAHIDAGNTATVGFELPAGYSVSSVLGYTPVPEPTIALMAFPILGLLRRRRRDVHASVRTS